MYTNNITSTQQAAKRLNQYVHYFRCFSKCNVLLKYLDLAHLLDKMCLVTALQLLDFNCTCCDESEMHFSGY